MTSRSCLASPGSSARKRASKNPDSHTRCSVVRALVLCAGLWGAAGCSTTPSVPSGTGGSGLADAGSKVGNAPAKRGNTIAQAADCNQTDTTVSCCLKKNPGQYERCGTVAPNQAPKPAPKRTPKDAPGPVALPPGASTEGRRERERRCRDYWGQCIAMGGEHEKRGQHGQTVCRACYERCVAEGFWPESVNDFQCLGGF